MAINLTVKTAVVRRTVTDSNNGHVYTIDGAVAVGNDAYGRCWAHVAAGALAQIVSVTPAQTLEAGSIINGAMLNPVRTTTSGANQGWDQRRNNWDATKNLTFPALVQQNDIVLKVESTITLASRSGFFVGQSALHILDHTPTGEYLLPSPVGWTGRTTFDEYPIDTDAWLAAKSTVSGGTWTSYTDINYCMSRASPSMAYRWGTGADNGYEGFSTYRMGRPLAWGGDTVNYGQTLARMLSETMLSMLSTNYTDEQRRRMCISIARMGLDWGEAALRGDAPYNADGGHMQWAGYPLIHALDLIGEPLSIPNVRDTAGGNMLQCYLLTAGLQTSHFSPHTSQDLPVAYKRRSLGAQPGGSVVRIPVSGSGEDDGDNDRLSIPAGAIATQFGGGKTATVAASAELATSGTIDVTLTGASPFLSGEEIYFDHPAGWKTNGIGEWAVRGLDANWGNAMTFSANISYRGLQRWGGQLMAICRLGLYDAATMEASRRYFERSMAANTPGVGNDYDQAMASWDPSNLANPGWFYTNHYVPL